MEDERLGVAHLHVAILFPEEDTTHDAGVGGCWVDSGVGVDDVAQDLVFPKPGFQTGWSFLPFGHKASFP